jgi:mRNA interferase HigB
VFNIITSRTINEYCEKYPEATQALRKWYSDFSKTDFSSTNELKSVYRNASIVGDNRVVFNIGGNKYRLVVRVSYLYKAVMIKWFGIHQEYDKIDVTTVQCER